MNKIAVYLGSSGHARSIFKEEASRLGQIIADKGKHLVYGGMDAGLMGLLAQSCLNHGGKVTGIIPRSIQDSERILSGLTQTLLVNELCDRKRLMFEEADAIIALPGGFGTLDESLEILYWGYLGLHSKPIIFVNIAGYWTSLLRYIQLLPDYAAQYCITVDNVDEAFTALATWKPVQHINTPTHMPHFEDEITRLTDQPIIIDRATIENTYFAVCALGLKQLGKHNRAVGFINTNRQFDELLHWINTAAKETFITPNCLNLFTSAETVEELHHLLLQQKPVSIDLHREKWGARVTQPALSGDTEKH